MFLLQCTLSVVHNSYKNTFGALFCPVSQQVKMDFIYSDNVRKLCLSCNVKNSKITVKLSEKKRNKRSSNRFLIVSFVKSARILLPFLIVAQHCVFLSNRCLCGLRFVYCSINFVYMECFVLCVKFQNFVYMLWVFVHCFLIFAFMD
jgi:hypothetical protein